MPAIQAMRSDALALRAKEDVQEKIPSFFNSVSQALGQNIISGQDNAEQLLEARFSAANALVGQIRQKVDGAGGISEMAAGAGFKLISSALSTLLSALSRTTTTDVSEMISAILNFVIESKVLKLQWEAVAATHAQWVVQAGYAGQGDFFDPVDPAATPADVTQTISQWLESPAPSVPPNPETNNLNLNFTTSLYNGDDKQEVPADIQLYTYNGTKVGGGSDPGLYINLVLDATGNNVYDAPGPTYTFDGDGNPVYTYPAGGGDSTSALYYSASTNKYYVKHSFEQTFTPGTATAIEGHTISINSRREDLDITTTTVDPYPSGYTDSRVFYVGGKINTTTSDGMYTQPVRTSAQLPLAIGGRGALKYRDAFTPRYTSRVGYANSGLQGGTPVSNIYQAYYGWGSVGSITRIGQYT